MPDYIERFYNRGWCDFRIIQNWSFDAPKSCLWPFIANSQGSVCPASREAGKFQATCRTGGLTAVYSAILLSDPALRFESPALIWLREAPARGTPAS